MTFLLPTKHCFAIWEGFSNFTIKPADASPMSPMKIEMISLQLSASAPRLYTRSVGLLAGTTLAPGTFIYSICPGIAITREATSLRAPVWFRGIGRNACRCRWYLLPRQPTSQENYWLSDRVFICTLCFPLLTCTSLCPAYLLSVLPLPSITAGHVLVIHLDEISEMNTIFPPLGSFRFCVQQIYGFCSCIIFAIFHYIKMTFHITEPCDKCLPL